MVPVVQVQQVRNFDYACRSFLTRCSHTHALALWTTCCIGCPQRVSLNFINMLHGPSALCVCVCVSSLAVPRTSTACRSHAPLRALPCSPLSPPSHLDAPFVSPAQQVAHGSDLIPPLLSVLARLGDQLCGCDIGHAHSLLDEHGPAAGTSPSSLVLSIMHSRQVSSLDSALSVASASHHLASAPNRIRHHLCPCLAHALYTTD